MLTRLALRRSSIRPGPRPTLAQLKYIIERLKPGCYRGVCSHRLTASAVGVNFGTGGKHFGRKASRPLCHTAEANKRAHYGTRGIVQNKRVLHSFRTFDPAVETKCIPYILRAYYDPTLRRLAAVIDAAGPHQNRVFSVDKWQVASPNPGGALTGIWLP